MARALTRPRPWPGPGPGPGPVQAHGLGCKISKIFKIRRTLSKKVAFSSQKKPREPPLTPLAARRLSFVSAAPSSYLDYCAASAQMNAILGDPDRIKALATDFIQHYERRLEEGSTVKGKAMFVCSKREIACALWRELIALRPQWNEVLACEAGVSLSAQEQKAIKPMERVKMIMTRGQDDPKELYNLLGSKEHRKELDRQFKNARSNLRSLYWWTCGSRASTCLSWTPSTSTKKACQLWVGYFCRDLAPTPFT